MVGRRRRISEAGSDVFARQVGEIRYDFGLAGTGGEHLQHVGDPDSRPDYDRPSAADGGIDGNAGVAGQSHLPSSISKPYDSRTRNFALADGHSGAGQTP